MKKYIFLLCLCVLAFSISGCHSEYVYIRDGYNKSSCTYYDMPYIKDYVDHKNEYVDYDDYMRRNYDTGNPYVNASNARRAYRNYAQQFNDRCFYPIELK